MQERKVILAGKQVVLGEMLEEDQKKFWEWHQNPDLLRLIVDHYAPTIEDQYAWFTKSTESDRKMFSLVTTPDNVLIGHGGFVDIDASPGTAQFRITVGDALYWGKGYGTEATSLILQHGFQQMGLKRIWLRVLPTNARAKRIYEKMGFTEYERVHNSYDNGEICLMEIFRERFR